MPHRKKPSLRRFDAMRLTPRELSWLFPAEIVARLDAIAAIFDFDPCSAPSRPMPENQVEYLAVLDPLVDLLVKREDTTTLRKRYARLRTTEREHLVHLVRTARDAALVLQSRQPDTPLGFPRGPRGMVSNLICASWFDLTDGGCIPVVWKPLD